MTEKEIQLLGFEQNLMNDHEGDTEYYYSYNIVCGLSLITNTNEEAQVAGWKIEIFNVDPPIQFENYAQVQAFINSMEAKIVK
jgi:hypothetical protein